MSATPSSVVFSRYPAALSLPSADPSGLAVETMLRFVNVRPTRKDARLGDLSLAIRDTTTTTAGTSSSEVCSGLLPCLRRLSHEEGVAPLTGSEATWVQVVTEHCIFPAFLFAMHFDPSVYQTGMARSVEPKVASFWEGMAGSYREHVLRANPFFYTGTAVAGVPRGRLAVSHIAKLREVGEEVDRAFAALEALCAAHCTTGDTFVMGTTKPTYLDALVYAAASSFFHAEVGEAAAVRGHQHRLMESCPRLLAYTERLRQQFFEADSGTYCLKPRRAAEEDAAIAMAAAAEQQYRRGRLQTLWWTGLFATVYFVLANADMVVALLEETLSAEEEEEDAAAVEAMVQAQAAAAARGHDGAATVGEPREL